jgi:hypothetical protein
MTAIERDKTSAGWCCTDCTLLLANGETDPSWPEAEMADYLERVDHETAGYEVTLGKFAEDHDCATNWTVTWWAPGTARGSYRHGTVEIRAGGFRDAMESALWHPAVPAGAWAVMARGHDLETEPDRGGDCDCERRSFSWSPCDVCGSNLGGTRDAVVFWPQDAAGAILPDTLRDLRADA